MIIRFSRHARRRARLYGIEESTIERILADMGLAEGEHEVAGTAPGIEYPIKIVVAVESDIITVVTSYPLKKGRGK